MLGTDHILEDFYAIPEIAVLVLEHEVVRVHFILGRVEGLDGVTQLFVALMELLNHLDGLDQLLGKLVVIKSAETLVYKGVPRARHSSTNTALLTPRGHLVNWNLLYSYFRMFLILRRI